MEEKKKRVEICKCCSRVYFNSLAKKQDHTGFCSKECQSIGPKHKLRYSEKDLNLIEKKERRRLRKLAREDYKKQSQSFLNSLEWKRLRMKVLNEYGYVCLCCGARPPEVKIVVDHIRPRFLYPELALVYDNLQPLCEACNDGKGIKYATDFRPKKTS